MERCAPNLPEPVTTFRHKIGSELYDLFIHDGPYMPGGGCEETVTYTIVKRTARYVYVHTGCDRPSRLYPGEHLARFSVDELERTGRAWNASHRMSLHTRPMPHWPLMPAIVTTPERLAIQ
jgi:hypothetical protein